MTHPRLEPPNFGLTEFNPLLKSRECIFVLSWQLEIDTNKTMFPYHKHPIQLQQLLQCLFCTCNTFSVMYYFTMIGITITFRCVWWVQSYFQGHIATIDPDHTMDKYHGFCFNHWVKKQFWGAFWCKISGPLNQGWFLIHCSRFLTCSCSY